MLTLLVTLEADPESRAVIADVIGTAARVVYLSDLAAGQRAAAIAEATVLLSRQTATELRPGEEAEIKSARLVQYVTAGVDYVPLNRLPAGVPVASNGGAFAEPMAEHALAMTLAALKRLPEEQAKLAAGAFDQHSTGRPACWQAPSAASSGSADTVRRPHV